MKTKRAKAPVETFTEVAVEESAEKTEYRAWAEKLKETNPMAYRKNEAQILAKLKQL